MQALQEKEIYCPYCGEKIDVLIDGSVAHQDYIEDCQVCCRPIVFNVDFTDNNDVLSLQVKREDE